MDRLDHAASADPCRLVSMTLPGTNATTNFPIIYKGKTYVPKSGSSWPTPPEKMQRLIKADRFEVEGNNIRYVLKLSDDQYSKLTLNWDDTVGARDKIYVVQTHKNVVERCLLLASDPGDLVLDPTCGSGTTAAVAEEWEGVGLRLTLLESHSHWHELD